MTGINISCYFLFALIISSANGQTEEDDVRLTAEREGPPQGGLFSPIPVVPFQKLKPRPTTPPKPQPPISTQSTVHKTRKPSTVRPIVVSTARPTVKPVQSEPTVQEPLPTRPLMQFVQVPVPTTPKVPHAVPQASSFTTRRPPRPHVTGYPDVTTYRPKGKPGVSEPVVTQEITPEKKPNVRLLYKVSRLEEDGGYFFDFISEDSIHRMERGYFKKDPDSDELIHVKTGLYSFESPEGEGFRVDYIADENGYRTFTPPPEGSAIPEIEINRNTLK